MLVLNRITLIVITFMNGIKITIKTKGLLVRTKDLGMGLSILSRINSNGIMKRLIIPEELLDKANDELQKASDTINSLSIKILLLRIREKLTNIKATAESNEEEKESSEEKPETKEKIQPSIKKETSKPKKKCDRTNSWTKEEIQILKDNINLSPKNLKKLIPNRSEAAIVWKRYELKGVTKKYRGRNKKVSKYNKPFSKEEINVIKDNMHLMPKQLRMFSELKGRGLRSISRKKWELKRKA